MGAVAGVVGMCLPGRHHAELPASSTAIRGDHVWVTCALKGVAAAAAGLAAVHGIQTRQEVAVAAGSISSLCW